MITFYLSSESDAQTDEVLPGNHKWVRCERGMENETNEKKKPKKKRERDRATEQSEKTDCDWAKYIATKIEGVLFSVFEIQA